jgi:hypothetical protein
MQKARTGAQVDYGLSTPVTAMGGADYGRQPKSEYATTSTIGAIDREDANLEAESGEIVFGDINGDTFPETNKIVGKRHSEGGVPLNLPSGTFIFSDTKSMKIKDCEILKMFNKPCGKRSYTPAKLAQVFDINAYREILQDPNSDKIDVRTAERMIRNYTVKLGALALAQESLKGFPDGIPEVAKPYMEVAGIREEDILPPPELTQTIEAVENEVQKKQPGNPDEQTGAPNQDMMASAEEMNQGNPVAAPMNPQGQPSPMAEPGMMQPQDQMMRFGGNYSGLDKFLGRAQEGMQQPSPEEMMMMEQQAMQEQGQPQMQDGQEQIMQLMQAVGQALEQGQDPIEVMAQLIQDQLPPEIIVQIFTQLGMPEEEVVQSLQMIMQQMQGAPQEEAMHQMPDGTMMPGATHAEATQMEQPMPPQQQMMEYGGSYSNLNKFIDGGEEMMMQEQAMAEGAPMDQAAGQDEMMQLVQGVMQALESGMPLEELTMSVLSSGISPELLMQVLAEVGIDEREAMEAVQNAVAEMSVAMQEGAPMQEEMPMEQMAMMRDGGSLPSYQSEGEVVLDKKKYTEKEFARAIFDAQRDGKKIVDPQGRPLSEEREYMPYDAEKMDSKGYYAHKFGKKNADGIYEMTDDQKNIAVQSYLMDKMLEDDDAVDLWLTEVDDIAAVYDDPDRRDLRDKYWKNGMSPDKVAQELMGNTTATWAGLDPDVKRKAMVNSYRKQSDQALYLQANKVDARMWKNNGNAYKSFADIQAFNNDPKNKGAEIKNPETGEPITTAAEYGNVQNWYKTNVGLDASDADHNLRNHFSSKTLFSNNVDADGNPIYGDNPRYGKKTVLAEQMGHLGFSSVAQKKRFTKEGKPGGYTDPDKIFHSQGFKISEAGDGDETAMFGNKHATSIDDIEGNTDVGMGNAYIPVGLKWGEAPKKDATPCMCKGKDGKDYHTGEYEEEGKPCKPCPPIDVAQDPPAKAGWWLQDTINTMGAFGDASFAGKGMMPFHQQVELANARATYLDPTKQAADIQSQYAQNLKTAASFAGPQALGSTMSRMSGDAASKSTGVINQVGQQNVGLANQFALKTAEMSNKQSLMNVKLDKTYFDELATKDARDRQEKLAARINRRKLYTTAIGNRAQTQALNTVNQEYNVDPTTGGFVTRTNTTRTPSGASTRDKDALIQSYIEKGATWEEATNRANSVYKDINTVNKSNANFIADHEGYGAAPNRTAAVNKTVNGRNGGQMPLDLFVNGGNVYPF